jgi:hypothetical protein
MTGVVLSSDLLGFSSPAAAQSPLPTGWSFRAERVSLTGGVYETPGSGGFTQRSDSIRLLPTGEMAAYQRRAGGLGNDPWLWDGHATRAVGPTGWPFEYQTPTGMRRDSVLGSGFSSAGLIGGRASRYTPSGLDAGFSAWASDGHETRLIGLTGEGYSKPLSDGEYHYSDSWDGSLAGHRIGYTQRFGPNNFTRGRDAWIYSDGETRALGLLDADHELPLTVRPTREHFPRDLNNRGQVVGTSMRFHPAVSRAGNDCWLFDGGTTSRINPVGPGYEWLDRGVLKCSSDTFVIDEAGTAVGTAERYDALGQSRGSDLWVHSEGRTQTIGLRGPGYEWGEGEVVHRRAVPRFNFSVASGRVIGQANRYDALGQSRGSDAFLFRHGESVPLTLPGPEYEWNDGGMPTRNSYAIQLNAAGAVAGKSTRYTATGQTLGSDVWITGDPADPRPERINPAGPGFEQPGSAGVYRQAELVSLGETGDAIGTAARFATDNTSLGTAGWFFDSISGQTVPLILSTGRRGQSLTEPQILLSGGIVLGGYDRYDEMGQATPGLFWWDRTRGFFDLASLLDRPLEELGILNLTEVHRAAGSLGGLPLHIAISARSIGESPVQPSTVFRLTLVPSPAPIAVGLVFAAGTSLRRRRPL